MQIVFWFNKSQNLRVVVRGYFDNFAILPKMAAVALARVYILSSKI